MSEILMWIGLPLIVAIYCFFLEAAQRDAEDKTFELCKQGKDQKWYKEAEAAIRRERKDRMKAMATSITIAAIVNVVAMLHYMSRR